MSTRSGRRNAFMGKPLVPLALGCSVFLVSLFVAPFLPVSFAGAQGINTDSRVLAVPARSARGFSLFSEETSEDADQSFEATCAAGIVRNTGRDALPNIRLTAYSFDTTTQAWQEVALTFTDDDGTFVFAGLISGSYRLLARDEDGRYLDSYWPQATSLATAEDMFFSSDAPALDLEMTLTEAAQVSGQLVDTAYSALSTITVTLYEQKSGQWHSVATTLTASDGSYSFDLLASGTYTLGFADRAAVFLPGFYAAADSIYDADFFVLSPGDGFVCALTAVRASRIEGKVSSTDGELLSGTTVKLYAALNRSFPVAQAVTDEQGAYHFAGLVSGSYVLEALPSDGRYLAQAWWGQATIDLADVVVVAKEAVVTLDFALARAPLPPPPDGSYQKTLTFVSEQGSAPDPLVLAYGSLLDALPEPVAHDYRFGGWYTHPEAGVRITAADTITADMILYARWVYVGSYTLRFVSYTNASYPECSVSANTAVGALPEPTRSSFSFGGWYTQPFGRGTQLTAASVIAEDTTLYAYWIATPGSLPSDDTVLLPDTDADLGLPEVVVPKPPAQKPANQQPPVPPKPPVPKLSGNAKLKAIKVSHSKLKKAFKPGRLKYTLTLSKKTARVTIRAAKADKTATVFVRKTKTKYKKARSIKVKLAKGKKVSVFIKVQAQNKAVKVYSIQISRKR